MTEELMAHAGILHLLAWFLCFPQLDMADHSLRNTDNHAIEAVHGVFRGGSHSLPFTSCNLSFWEFLRRINKMSPIRTVEHFPHEDEGNSIVAIKKKRLTINRQVHQDHLTLIANLGAILNLSPNSMVVIADVLICPRDYGSPMNIQY